MCLPMRFNKLFVILLKWDVPCGRLQASGPGSDDIIQWLSLVFLEGQYVAWGPAGGGALRCSAICLLLHVTLNQKSLSSVSVMLSCLWQIIFFVFVIFSVFDRLFLPNYFWKSSVACELHAFFLIYRQRSSVCDSAIGGGERRGSFFACEASRWSSCTTTGIEITDLHNLVYVAV